MQHFYDAQIRRYLKQFIRALSHFYVKTGKDSNGNEALLRVPARYGDGSKQASAILKGNSEATLNSTPQISCYISGLVPDTGGRRMAPTHIGKLHARERHYDKATGEYTGAPGEYYTVERPMPVPYTLSVTADIWSSNTDQKLQILEQILYFFNPSLELQTTDNYVDWTSITTLTLKDINWSSRSIPVGSSDDIDIATLTFDIPIWINPPSLVKRRGLITTIVMGIYDSDGNLSDAVLDDNNLMGSRFYYTPLNHGLLLINGEMRALRNNEPVSGDTAEDVDFDHVPAKLGDPVPWPQVIGQYGILKPGISQIKLLQIPDFVTPNMVYDEVIGTVEYNPSDDTILNFTVDSDSIPANTQTAINAIINPQKTGPGSGLPAATTGQRYLILDGISSSTNTAGGAAAWPGADAGTGLVANRNDIIEYNGSEWVVDFDSATEEGTEYVSNLTTGIQYKWADGEWVKSYEGEYAAGSWSISLFPE